MNNIVFAATMSTIAFCVSPSLSLANCVATGEVPRVNVKPSGTVVALKDNNPTGPYYSFTTVNGQLVTASLIAQSSHMTVQITGNATTCGPIAGGISNGGTILGIL